MNKKIIAIYSCGGVASQSSTLSTKYASLAIAGNKNGNWYVGGIITNNKSESDP